MSTKTPTKQRSSSKKTPTKSATIKQQHPAQQPTPLKSTPKSTKKTNLFQDIKQQFLTQSLVDETFTHKELTHELKRILALEVEAAAEQLAGLITNHKASQSVISQSFSKLSSENLSGLVYLLEHLISDPAINPKSSQPQTVQPIDLVDWIATISEISPDLIFYSEKLKHSIKQLSQNTSFHNELSSIKGKIALITQH